MKLSLETRSANIIHSYETGSVKIQQYSADAGSDPYLDPSSATGSDTTAEGQHSHSLMTLTSSLIVTPDQLIQDWLDNPPNLTQQDMQRLLEIDPEVILLGTGQSLTFPKAEILQQCYQEKIGIEVMNTPAACRTYNVLASENRRVAAALMIV